MYRFHAAKGSSGNGRLLLRAIALLFIATRSSFSSEPHLAVGKKISAVEGVSITVSDLDQSARFFVDVLDFEHLEIPRELDAASTAALCFPDDPPKVARLRLGDESVELIQFSNPGRPMPPDSRSNDRWFQHIAVITGDMDEACARLRAHNVKPASVAPQTLPAWNANAAGIRAYYFRDPDGHFLEILQFPPDKGDRKWHQKSDRLFLGIDHTAIVVADTGVSLRYYRDALGLRVAGRSENYGVEQEKLNNVPGAHLRITTLRAARGPGIELLEYIYPREGRAYPADSMANDHWHWHLRLLAESATGAIRTGAFERDPDGHAILIKAGPAKSSSDLVWEAGDRHPKILVAKGIMILAVGYLGTGILVALAFVAFVVHRIDPAAQSSGVIFRAMILPGCALLWPLIARRWIRFAARSTQ